MKVLLKNLKFLSINYYVPLPCLKFSSDNSPVNKVKIDSFLNGILKVSLNNPNIIMKNRTYPNSNISTQIIISRISLENWCKDRTVLLFVTLALKYCNLDCPPHIHTKKYNIQYQHYFFFYNKSIWFISDPDKTCRYFSMKSKIAGIQNVIFVQ
jgi:hypothetical protein